MTEPATGSVVAPTLALSLSGFWGASILGLPVATIVIVTGVVVMGAFGRLGFEIATQAETAYGIKWGRIAALFGGSLISAPTLAVGCLLGLKSAGIQSDGAEFFGALVCGILGPKALLWLYSMGSNVFSKKTGMTLPTFGDQPAGPGK